MNKILIFRFMHAWQSPSRAGAEYSLLSTHTRFRPQK